MSRFAGWRIDLLWSALLAMVILGPVLLGTGYVLHGDLVFVPDQPWKPAWLGLDGQVPRSVPMDALVWASTLAAPGWLVERVFLAGALVLAGVGAGRLVASHGAPARLAAITFFVWNPWVHERLAIGQWALVAGYACLPWAVRAAVRWRDDPKAWAPAFAWLVAAAVCGPAPGILATLVIVGVTAWSGVRRVVAAAAFGTLANLPWLLPSVLLPEGLLHGTEAYAAFAPRAESGAGVLASLLSLGGIWKTSILAGERTSALVVVASCAVVLAAAAGWRRAAREDRPLVRSLAGAAVLALVLCALTTVRGVQDALDSAARHAPGLALFRDSHRVLAVVAVALVPGVAGAVSALVERGGAPGREGLRTVAALLGVAPLLMLPSMGWGLAGRLDPVTWPAGWREVADRIGPDDRTVVLPWSGGYRGFVWNDHQAALDPAPRQLPGEVLIDDRVLLDGAILPHESPYLARVGDALVQTDPAAALRRLGVRWVLVEHGTGLVVDIPRGQTVFEDSDLTLIDLGDPGTAARADTPARPPAAMILGGDLVTIAVLAAGLFRYYRRVT